MNVKNKQSKQINEKNKESKSQRPQSGHQCILALPMGQLRGTDKSQYK